MKTKFLLLLFFSFQMMYSQDTMVGQPRYKQYSFATEKRKHVFSVSPMSKKTAKVNGLVFGFGHIDNKLVEKQTINGLNIEANPSPVVGAFIVFIAIMHLPEVITAHSGGRYTTVGDTLVKQQPDFVIPNWDKTPDLKLNGLNISSGCFFTNTSMNGLNVSLGNKFKNFNGLSIAPLGTLADRQIGISLGLINANNDLNGFVVGAYNQSFKLDGLQIGLVNQTITNHGLQVGFFNRSYSNGFQIGIWNKNTKRSFPILNW